MITDKLIVNMDPDQKREFMAACGARFMSASAVVRHLVAIQLDAWKKSDADIIQKL
jgi:hypothetical protein